MVVFLVFVAVFSLDKMIEVFYYWKGFIIIKYWLYLVFLMVPGFLLRLRKIVLVLQYTLQRYNRLQQVRMCYKTLQKNATWGLVWTLFKRYFLLKEGLAVTTCYNKLKWDKRSQEKIDMGTNFESCSRSLSFCRKRISYITRWIMLQDVTKTMELEY